LAAYIAVSAARTASSACRPGHGDPDAGGQLQPVPADRQRLGERGHDAVRDRDPGHRFAGQRDHELVAAQPGDQRAGRDDPRQPGGQRTQRVVAGSVAGPVVDRLEPVDVQVDHGGRAGATGQHRDQVLLERGPRQQPGQRVLADLTLQLGLVLLLPGDVQQVHEDPLQVPVGVPYAVAVDLHPDLRTVVVAQVALGHGHRVADREQFVDDRSRVRVERGHRQVLDGETGRQLLRQI
jgi:hypothetical protein